MTSPGQRSACSSKGLLSLPQSPLRLNTTHAGDVAKPAPSSPNALDRRRRGRGPDVPPNVRKRKRPGCSPNFTLMFGLHKSL